MLIKCPECGKEISDKALSCPNCGCPMIKKNHCIINGVDIDCSFVFNDYDLELRQMEMVDKTNLDMAVADRIVEEWSKSGTIPPVFNGKISTWEEDHKKAIQKAQAQNTPHCPTCGSPDVQKIGGVERAASIGMFGIFSRKINKSMKCRNCGYMW